ncbi:MAG: hypothetical protein A2087_01540 [Spirochaetes bacterium GWD1_61_31]|nr:MAG: hypothetical protein A2Y37_12440 [Spirochaetes bacterium GWB1_60_80]OHD30177.1 MAG: hypothetical protein A2004_14305 [Spirochaetes bacterium GWC1_61_12]OHD35876.1 MAG: hypothetical protein A2087_01540 [Spirochaetes bacterium GWD1_61_31]OHD42163.1 MAG: hypothetical protein A2Y35_06495 [Spirochaetes bacterium GWE1_60_18]OHD59439.1 MAG: hypothetical protein A2Y32_09935 [Spirochaetes bacterium GWF1_60_12]HAP44048.1 DNA-binding response regulator [Spirochaetaceae bacterium]
MSYYRRRLLLVEDEPGLVLTLGDLLRAEGYEVEAAGDAAAAERRLAAAGFDLMLLDVMLPGRSGLDLLRDLRAKACRLPILMLTAKATPPERVVGLKLGADDYLAKPFDSLELLARIEALLRRSQSQGQPSPSGFGGISIDAERSEAKRGDTVLPLTSQEYRLLLYLLEHSGKTLSRDRLLDEVWGYGADAASRTIDVHISALRQKIEDDAAHPRHIITVRGFGYRFEP